MARAGGTHLAAAVPHFSSNALYGMLFVGAGWLPLLAWATFGLRGGRVSVVSLVAVLALAVGGSTLAVSGLASGTEGHHAEASEPGSQGDYENCPLTGAGRAGILRA